MPPNSEKEFKNLYHWAFDNAYIDKGRIRYKSKKSGKLPRSFTKSQLIKIFEAIRRPKDAIACFMALMCGLRIEEVCSLEVKDIDFENHKIFIGDSKNTNRKGDNYGNDRYVEFPRSIEGIIKRWLEVIGDTSKWFLPSDKSSDLHLRTKSIHERFRSYLKDAGLLIIEYTRKAKVKVNGKTIEKSINKYKYAFHCFRHTYACMVYNKTGDIYIVNRLLGHRQLDTTMVYAKMTDAKRKNTIETVFALLSCNYENGMHLINPEPVKRTAQSQQVIPANIEPIKLLELQFVNGETSEDEFLKRRKVLQSVEVK
jgi:integrase